MKPVYIYQKRKLDESLKKHTVSYPLPGGVMVAQLILVQFVEVRILAGQPFFHKAQYRPSAQSKVSGLIFMSGRGAAW